MAVFCVSFSDPSVMENEVNLDGFLRYDVPALKHYLIQQGLAVSGMRDELASRP